jgi:hypothetical protein
LLQVKRLGLKQSGRLGVRRGAIGAGAVGTPGRRCKQEVDFLAGLYEHMAHTKQPIEKVPSLGFKQLDLWAFYKKVRSNYSEKNFALFFSLLKFH